MKKLITISISIFITLFVITQVASAFSFSDLFGRLKFGATILQVNQGGTGASTLTGCLEGNGTGAITGTGSACGSGGTGDFAWSVLSWGNATSTTLGLLGGVFSNASSTLTTLHTGLSDGFAYIGSGMLKSVSTSTALASKQDILVSGTNIKTINGSSVLGSGDLTIVGSGSGLASSTPWTLGSLVVAKDNSSVTTIATSSLNTSEFTNDAGFITAADVPAAETDSAHDTCGEISGCVVGAITGIAWGDITGTLSSQTDLNNYFIHQGTTSVSSITALPNLGITESQISDLGTYLPTADFGSQFYTFFSGTTTDYLTEGSVNKYFPGFTNLLTDYSFTDNSSNWNTAYGWGNHATAGYLPASAYYSTTTQNTITTLPSLSLPATQLTSFGVPFYQFFSATNTDALTQGSVNKYWSNTLFDNRLSASSSISGITALPNLSITKSQVSDFGTYQEPLVSGTNIKTINGSSVLGSGDLTVTGSGSGLASSTPWTFGSLVVAKDNGSVTTIATSSINGSEITNDLSWITAADVPANETDSAHDTCAEITGCVTGALSAYDAWTHPAAGQSATTSLIKLFGSASSTLFSANWLKVGGSASSTIGVDGILTSPAIRATANDSGSIGVAGTAFADLFLADGGAINFNNGEVTITNGALALDFAGTGISNGFRFAGPVTPNTDGGTSLGASGIAWSSLYLANLATINFSTDVTLTHSSGKLTLSASDNFTSTYSSSTAYSSFINASSTNLFAGNLTLSTTTVGCLNTSATGVVYSATCGSGSPGGSDTQVQFNNGGSFDGDANFVWDGVGKRLIVGNSVDNTFNIGLRPGSANVNALYGGSGGAFPGLFLYGEYSDDESHVGAMLQLDAMASDTGIGGTALLFGGMASTTVDANGGSAVMQGQAGNGSGLQGTAAILTGDGSGFVVGGLSQGFSTDLPSILGGGGLASFDNASLTGDQIYAFPDASGTFCLTSTCLSSMAWTYPFPSGATTTPISFTYASTTMSTIDNLYLGATANVIEDGDFSFNGFAGRDIVFNGGSAVSGPGGRFVAVGGDGSNGEDGGDVQFSAGSGGAADGGNGGGVIFEGGAARSGDTNGGGISFIAGSGFGAGASGSILFDIGGSSTLTIQDGLFAFNGGSVEYQTGATLTLLNADNDAQIDMYNSGGTGENYFGIDVSESGGDFSIDNSGLLSFAYSSSTDYSSFETASSTYWHGGGLQTCNAETGKLTWANGVFGCGTDYNTGEGGVGVGTISTSTSPTIGNLAYWTSKDAWPETLGTIATTSLTINSPLTTSGTAGALVGGTNLTIDIDDIKAADLDLTDITLVDFTNDAGFTTFAYPFPSAATSTPLTFTGLFTSTYASSTYSSFITASTSQLVASTKITFWDKVWNSFADFTTEIRGLFTGGDHITITAGDIDVDDDFILNTGDTGAGAYDFSGATIQFPFAANPTVNANGEASFDSTAASSSLRWYDGSERVLYDTIERSFFLSTSTLATFNGSGTTTIEMRRVYRPQTLVAVSCTATTTGTAFLNFGDGTNWTNLVSCNTTGAWTTISANNTFVMGEMMKFRIGTHASIDQGYTISYVIKETAD